MLNNNKDKVNSPLGKDIKKQRITGFENSKFQLNSNLTKPIPTIRGIELEFTTDKDRELYESYIEKYKDYARTTRGGKAFIVKEYTSKIGAKSFTFQSYKDFKDAHSSDNFYLNTYVGKTVVPRRVYFANHWLNEAELSPSYRDCVFQPNPALLEKDEFNFWRGFIKPMEGSVKVFLDYIDKLIVGTQADKDYVVKLLAWVYQNPEKAPGVLLMLMGEQGVGKSLLVEICRRMCPAHTYTTSKLKNILGFNSHTHHVKIIGLEEAFCDGADRITRNEFKHFITGKEREIEGKGVDARTIDNIIFYIATSNEERPLSIDNDDRRHAVFNCVAPTNTSKAYFKAIFDWLDNENGAAKILDYLLKLDLTGFDTQGSIPANSAKARLKTFSGDTVERFMIEFLSGSFEEEIQIDWKHKPEVVRSELYALYKKHNHKYAFDNQMFTSRLKCIFDFPENFADNWKERGGARRRVFKFEDLETAQKLMAKHMRSDIGYMFGKEDTPEVEEQEDTYHLKPGQKIGLTKKLIGLKPFQFLVEVEMTDEERQLCDKMVARHESLFRSEAAKKAAMNLERIKNHKEELREAA